LADDYASKGEEEMIEVKIEDDIIFLAKKEITLKSSALQKPEAEDSVQLLDEDEDDIADMFNMDIADDIEDEEESPEEEEIEHALDGLSKGEFPSLGDIYVENPTNDTDVLSAKLSKSLAELEEIRSSMNNTFTSTDTISTTIQSLKGMLDAIKKDQNELLSKR
jgi:hypothetical protein